MLSLNAYAKINLGLEVLRKRPDGYHDINTVFLRIGLHDVLSIDAGTEPTSPQEISVSCLPSLGIAQEQNLAYKAAEQLRQAYSIRAGAKITIHKHIPNGAGLGGGSSDAAAVLRGLCSLWGIDINDAKVFAIAEGLGSDVPYFLQQGAALAQGKGEELSYFRCVPSAPWYILLVFPDVHVSTPQAYANLHVHEEGRSGRALRDIVLMACYEKAHLQNYLVNDFERVIFAKYPQIADVKAQLYEAGAFFALMSGSGSSVYGLFDDETQALKAALHFRKYRCFVCPIAGEETV